MDLNLLPEADLLCVQWGPWLLPRNKIYFRIYFVVWLHPGTNIDCICVSEREFGNEGEVREAS